MNIEAIQQVHTKFGLFGRTYEFDMTLSKLRDYKCLEYCLIKKFNTRIQNITEQQLIEILSLNKEICRHTELTIRNATKLCKILLSRMNIDYKKLNLDQIEDSFIQYSRI